jgi:MerR family copper efflux transcriptional regulator
MSPRPRLAATAQRFRIGELATQGGVSRDAIRFYEREGLLPRPRRTPSKHRVYDHRAIEQIHFIRRAQDMGLSLADIRRLLALRDANGARACQEAADVLAARLGAYEERIAAFEAYRERLREAVP